MSDKVVFAGVRRDAALCYSAMDVLAFPSLYEGLPNVIVEAQANGLPCIVSDTVTKEVSANENVTFVPLEKGSKAGAEEIIGNQSRRLTSDELRIADEGYDINTELARFISVVFGE